MLPKIEKAKQIRSSMLEAQNIVQESLLPGADVWLNFYVSILSSHMLFFSSSQIITPALPEKR